MSGLSEQDRALLIRDRVELRLELMAGALAALRMDLETLGFLPRPENPQAGQETSNAE
jgi:hypothetical protein